MRETKNIGLFKFDADTCIGNIGVETCDFQNLRFQIMRVRVWCTSKIFKFTVRKPLFFHVGLCRMGDMLQFARNLLFYHDKSAIGRSNYWSWPWVLATAFGILLAVHDCNLSSGPSPECWMPRAGFLESVAH